MLVPSAHLLPDRFYFSTCDHHSDSEMTTVPFSQNFAHPQQIILYLYCIHRRTCKGVALQCVSVIHSFDVDAMEIYLRLLMYQQTLQLKIVCYVILCLQR